MVYSKVQGWTGGIILLAGGIMLHGAKIKVQRVGFMVQGLGFMIHGGLLNPVYSPWPKAHDAGLRAHEVWCRF